ncbi:uncharacterized protein C1orf115-like [Dromiciops gliroides]|uniref:uncharacterized protein C1orf115-like n=1 Tax=Dromiciops gliroides TaxID=33562 RepID=UPI001CC78F2C|nr:uncharacterized protein C1orf115-like [Dromiciops gliroides]
MAGNRLRDKSASRYLSRLQRQEQKEEEEEGTCTLQHPQLEEEGEETKGGKEQLQHPEPQGNARGDKRPHSKKVHFAFFQKGYQPLKEETDEEKSKENYWKVVKKYGKNAGKMIIEECRSYFTTDLQGLDTTYSSPFAESATFPPLSQRVCPICSKLKQRGL